jgi:hypothetical protein
MFVIEQVGWWWSVGKVREDIAVKCGCRYVMVIFPFAGWFGFCEWVVAVLWW